MAIEGFFWDPYGILGSFFYCVTTGMGLTDPYGILVSLFDFLTRGVGIKRSLWDSSILV